MRVGEKVVCFSFNILVGLFDTKRIVRVQKGREAQEREKREREKSELDLELDFLAPFLIK